MKIIQVASKPVHRVADHGIALAYVADELLELGPMHVLARRLFGEALIEVDSFELAELF